MSSTRSKFAPIAICIAFGLAACGDDGTTTSTGTETATPVDGGDGGGYDPPATTVAAATTVPEAPATTVAAPVDFDVVLGSSGLGMILADSDGNTLYLFASDPPNTASCTGACANTWPPLLADGDLQVGIGLDASLFTEVAGAGGQQVAYNGHPLYYYSGDSGPGDTNGQAVGGVWFVVDAAGNAVT